MICFFITKQKPPFLRTEAHGEEKILFSVGRIVRLSLFGGRLCGSFDLSVYTAGHAFGVAAAAYGLDNVEHHAGHDGKEVFHGGLRDDPPVPPKGGSEDPARGNGGCGFYRVESVFVESTIMVVLSSSPVVQLSKRCLRYSSDWQLAGTMASRNMHAAKIKRYFMMISFRNWKVDYTLVSFSLLMAKRAAPRSRVTARAATAVPSMDWS